LEREGFAVVLIVQDEQIFDWRVGRREVRRAEQRERERGRDLKE
jgi:hypothetical protein